MHLQLAHGKKRRSLRSRGGRGRAGLALLDRARPLLFPEEAAHFVTLCDSRPAGRLGCAAVEGKIAALGEPATAEFLRERRHLALDDRELGAALAGRRERREELARVGMLGRGEETLALGELDDLARVHDRDV